MQKLNYDKIKQVKNNDGDNILLVKTIYDIETGIAQEQRETMVDVDMIDDRISALQTEINKLQAIKTCISEKSFDIVEDKRSFTK